jgi:hypothetical protein
MRVERDERDWSNDQTARRQDLRVVFDIKGIVDSFQITNSNGPFTRKRTLDVQNPREGIASIDGAAISGQAGVTLYEK